ncbi:MAG: FHA domain-containing protein, partial [Pseudomonadota bacterium]
MILTLKIENQDSFDDGGPVDITVDGKGLTAGRGRAMDWVLPDPTRHISSHHFEVDYADGAYFLTDVSTNGTFLVGQPYRLEPRYRLNHMDRFQVGHFIIAVSLQAPGPMKVPAPGWDAPAPAPAPAAPAPVADDPWAVDGPTPAP